MQGSIPVVTIHHKTNSTSWRKNRDLAVTKAVLKTLFKDIVPQCRGVFVQLTFHGTWIPCRVFMLLL